MGSTENMEAIIELNPETVRQRQDTYSSLTDLHGIPIFSNDFKEKVDFIKENIKLEEKALYSSIFVDKFKANDGKDEMIISHLFTEKEAMVLKQDYQSYGKRISVVEVAMVTLAVIGVTILYVFVFGNKRVRR